MPLEEQDRILDDLRSARPAAAVVEGDRRMLEYVVKLTLTPGDLCEDDVCFLRAVGFDDRGIHDICAITAYFAFVNRIADGLGVEIETA